MTLHQNIDDTKSQVAQLTTFLKWLAVSVFATSLLSFMLALVTAQTQNLWAALSLLCYGGVIVLASAQVRQQKVMLAVTMICLGLMILGICNVVLLPELFPIFLALPTTALALALPYVNAASLLRMSIGAVIAAFITLAVGLFWPGNTPLDPFAVQISMLLVGPSGTALIALLLWQFHSRLTEALSRANRTNAELNRAQSGLEYQVADRTAELVFTLTQLEYRNEHQASLLAELEQQRDVIREMSVPVLPVSATTLVMPLVGALDTQRLQDVQEQALAAIARSHARRLLLDITGVPVVDSQVAQGLLMVVQAARLLGATVLLIGVRPEVAQALVSLGVDLGDITTCSDLQTALVREHVAS